MNESVHRTSMIMVMKKNTTMMIINKTMECERQAFSKMILMCEIVLIKDQIQKSRR